jgi:hypothetical protein
MSHELGEKIVSEFGFDAGHLSRCHRWGVGPLAARRVGSRSRQFKFRVMSHVVDRSATQAAKTGPQQGV